MSPKLPVPLRKRLRSRDKETRETAFQELIADPAQVELVYQNPNALVTKSGGRTDGGRNYYLERITMLLPSLSDVAMAWANERTMLRWPNVDPSDAAGLSPRSIAERVARFGGLLRLELDRVELDLGALRLASVTTLVLVECTMTSPDLGALADGLPALENLVLRGVSLTRIAGLEGCTQLTGLELHRMPLTLEAGTLPPGLRRLVLEALPISDLAALVPLEHLEDVRVSCAALESLAPWNPGPTVRLDLTGSGLVDTQRLRADERGALTLRNLPITTLRGLDPAVRDLGLISCDALTDLVDLPRDLETLTVWHCAQLQRLDGVEGCTRLTRVSLRGRAITDISALATLPSLVMVDARLCAGLATLGDLPASGTLRALALADTSVRRADVPTEHRWKCSWALRADLEAMLTAAPPEPTAPLLRDQRKVLAGLRKLLKSKRVVDIEQGLELAASFGDATIYDALLEKVSWRPAQRRAFGQTGGATIVDGGFSGAYGQYAVAGLIATGLAESERVAALRDEIVQLDLTATRNQSGNAPVRPAHLAGLPRLKSVSMFRVGPIRTDEAPAWPQLERLWIAAPGSLPTLDWLAGATNLATLGLANTTTSAEMLTAHELSLSRATLRCQHPERWPLRALNLGHGARLDPPEALVHFTNIEQLRVDTKQLAHAAQLPKLQALTIGGTDVDLRPLAGHPTLRTLRFEDRTAVDLDALARITHLETVSGPVSEEIRARYPERAR